MKINSTKDITITGKFNALIYGESGVGKTRLIRTLPGKTLIIDTDRGLLSLRDENIDSISPSTWPEFIECLEMLKKDNIKKEYDNIVFDCVSSFMRIFLAKLEKDAEQDSKKDGFVIWKKYGNFISTFLTYVTTQSDYNMICIFKAINEESETGVIGKGFGIKGSAGDPSEIAGYFNHVMYLRENKDKKIMLNTITASGWKGKDRSNKLLAQEEPDLALVFKKIYG